MDKLDQYPTREDDLPTESQITDWAIHDDHRDDDVVAMIRQDNAVVATLREESVTAYPPASQIILPAKADGSFWGERFRVESNRELADVVDLIEPMLGQLVAARWEWEWLTRGLSQERAFQEVSEMLDRHLSRIRGQVLFEVEQHWLRKESD
jgi:hypothetical protein